MKLNKIILKNFFNHENATLDLTQIESPTLLVGGNGIGKSTLVIESLTFALFGETRVANIDDAIRHGADSMMAMVEFEINNQLVRVARTKRRGKPQKLELSINNVIIDELLSEVQKRINNIVKLSPEAFRSSIFLRQDDANFFAKAKPQERQEIIGELLGLSQYERLEKLAREQRAELKTEIKAKTSNISDMEEVDIDELESNITTLEKMTIQNEKKIKKLSEELNEINSYNAMVIEQEKNKQNIVKKNNQIKERIELNKKTILQNMSLLENLKKEISHKEEYDLDALQESVNQFSEKVEELELEISKAKLQKDKEISEIQKEKLDLEKPLTKSLYEKNSDLSRISKQIKQLKSLESADCPTCLRSLNESEIDNMVSDFAKEVEGYNSEIESLNIEIKRLNEKFSNKLNEVSKKSDDLISALQEDKLKNYNKQNTLQKKIKEILKEQQAYLEYNQKIASMEQKNINLAEENEFLGNQFQDIPRVELSLKEDDEIKNKINESQKNQKEAISILATTKHKVEVAKKNQERKERILQEISDSQKRYELLDNLVTAFSKNGIQASIVESILPQIEEITNNYLEKMSEDDFQFRFITTVANQKGDNKNTLDLEIFKNGSWRKFDNLSGGEQFVVTLALRLSLAQILTRRAGIQLETLILDEAAVYADFQTRNNFVQVIKSLKDIFPRIILTTHIEDIAQEFENRIDLKKIKKA